MHARVSRLTLMTLGPVFSISLTQPTNAQRSTQQIAFNTLDRESAFTVKSQAGAGPDLIIGSLIGCYQFSHQGAVGEGVVGLAVGEITCNAGDEPALYKFFPSIDHPVFTHNLYRLSIVHHHQRFEQLGYGWARHSFTALQQNYCELGCVSSGTGSLLGVGCSDPISTSLSAAHCALGPRSVINPYTGEYPESEGFGEGGGCNSNFAASNHIGHQHHVSRCEDSQWPCSSDDDCPGYDSCIETSTNAHRIQVRDVDLIPTSDEGPRYFAEGQCITPHEFTDGNGNQNNNVSHRELEVRLFHNESYDFSMIGGTIREVPALAAWTGARVELMEPAPWVDGWAFVGYQVTALPDQRWHYEYAVYNMHLDRAVGSFRVPLPPGVDVTHVDFHQPLHHEPDPNSPSYSPDPWDIDLATDAIIWSTDPFDVDPLANAIRYGTLYNFRFDADAPPTDAKATVGLFKTGDFVDVPIKAPASLAPIVIHGSAIASFESHAFSGFVDARFESDNGQNINRGLSHVTFHFDQPVEHLGGGTLTPDAFTVHETGDGPPPHVSGVDTADDQTVTVQLDRIITLKEWTTVIAHVQTIAGGVPIGGGEDLGPGQFEPDRIDVAFLPFDVDQNGHVQPLDLLRFRQMLTAVYAHPRGLPLDYIDTDRNGTLAPLDLLKFRQLWSGTGNATQPWAGESLNHNQP